MFSLYKFIFGKKHLLSHLALVVLSQIALSLVVVESAFAQIPDTTSIKKPVPQRIISLSPHVTEMIFSAGAGDRLVGVVSYSDFPKAAQNITNIGSYQSINIEKIIQLNPDMIIAWQTGNQSKDIEKLTQLGFTIRYSNPHKLSDIPKEIRRFGKIFQTESQANKVANKLEQKLQTLKTNQSKLQPVSAYYQIWNKPMMTINGKQFISQALDLCGAHNIFNELPSLTPQISIESVIKRNPQVILLGGQKAMQQAWLKDWQKWPNISAVQNQHIYTLNADTFQRPTARLINGIEGLCNIINQAGN